MIFKINNILKNRIYKSTLIYVLGAVIIQLSNFFSNLFLMNYLTLEQFGLYSFITGFVSIFAFFSDGGLTTYLIRELSKAKNDIVSYIYKKAQGAQLIISSLILFLSIFFYYFWKGTEDLNLLIIFSFATVTNSLFAPLNAFLVAKEKMGLIFRRDLIIAFSKLFFFVFGIWFRFGISYFLFYNLFSFLLQLLLWIYIKSKKIKFLLSALVSINNTVSILKGGIIFTELMIANVIYNKIDIIIIERMLGDKSVGIYSGATKLIYPLMFLASAFTNVVLPRLSISFKNENNFSEKTYKSIKYIGIFGLIVSLSLYLMSTPIYHILFNTKYDSSISIYKTLIWYLSISFCFTPISAAIISAGYTKFLVIINALMILLNIILNIMLIPLLNVEGAAIATITCELIILISSTIFSREVLKIQIPYKLIGLITITSVIFNII